MNLGDSLQISSLTKSPCYWYIRVYHTYNHDMYITKYIIVTLEAAFENRNFSRKHYGCCPQRDLYKNTDT